MVSGRFVFRISTRTAIPRAVAVTPIIVLPDYQIILISAFHENRTVAAVMNAFAILFTTFPINYLLNLAGVVICSLFTVTRVPFRDIVSDTKNRNRQNDQQNRKKPEKRKQECRWKPL